MQRTFIQTSGGAKGGKLAVAVAGNRVRRDAEALQQSQRAQAGGTDGRLRHLGGPKCFVLAQARFGIEGGKGIDDVGEDFSVARDKAVVCCGNAVEQLRETAGEVVQHAAVLGTLAGEEHTELSLLLTAGEKGAVGSLPGGFRVLFQHRLGVFQKRCQVGLVALHDERQPAGRLGVEGGT